jgi:hypothetical protein
MSSITAAPSWLGQATSSAGINPNAAGEVSIVASNTTVTSPYATTSSVILITPYSPTNNYSSVAQVTTRSNGSFVILSPNYVVGLKMMWLIAK